MKLSKKILLTLLTGIITVYFNNSKSYADIPYEPGGESSGGSGTSSTGPGSGNGGTGGYSETETVTFDDGSTLSTTQQYDDNGTPVGSPTVSSTPSTENPTPGNVDPGPYQ